MQYSLQKHTYLVYFHSDQSKAIRWGSEIKIKRFTMYNCKKIAPHGPELICHLISLVYTTKSWWPKCQSTLVRSRVYEFQENGHKP